MRAIVAIKLDQTVPLGFYPRYLPFSDDLRFEQRRTVAISKDITS
jgi:hypothetical protein